MHSSFLLRNKQCRQLRRNSKDNYQQKYKNKAIDLNHIIIRDYLLISSSYFEWSVFVILILAPFGSCYNNGFMSSIFTTRHTNFQRVCNQHYYNYYYRNSFYNFDSKNTRKMTSISDNNNQKHNDDHHLDNDNPLVNLGLPSPLILGSASFTRKLILNEMNIPYNIIIRPIDEDSIGNRTIDKPNDLVLKIATAKMKHLIQEIINGNCHTELPDYNNNVTEYVILTADQVVTCNNRILEKAQTIEEAVEFISLYGIDPCMTVGAIVLQHIPSLIQVSDIHIATVYFKSDISNNASQLVQQLLDVNAPILSCSGALMIEHPLVQQYIDRIDGEIDSIMGLSKDNVLKLLHELKNKIREQI